MKSGIFEGTTRQLIFGLPIFMGMVEYILRVALKQAGETEFFPISLVASAVSLNVALTALPCGIRKSSYPWILQRRIGETVLIAKLGVFASLGGALLWIYLLVASLSQDVRELFSWHPAEEAMLYYAFSVALTEYKAWVEEC